MSRYRLHLPISGFNTWPYDRIYFRFIYASAVQQKSNAMLLVGLLQSTWSSALTQCKFYLLCLRTLFQLFELVTIESISH